MPEAVIRTENYLEGSRVSSTTSSDTNTHGRLGDREKVVPPAVKAE